jgi:hypothetical protein
VEPKIPRLGSLLDSFTEFHQNELGWFYESILLPAMYERELHPNLQSLEEHYQYI